MAKEKLTAPEQVRELVQKLPAGERALMEQIIPMFLGVDPLISEQVKWNSVSFYYGGEMAPFDPKQYKRDIVVCNLHRGKLLLVFPTGADIKTELNGKDYPDGRKIISIEHLDDLQQKSDGLIKLIKDWLEKVERVES